MSSYRERLWPAPWMYIVIALIIPATMLVFTPISIVAGVVTALVLVAGSVGVLLWLSPVITVDAHRLTAGRASIPVTFLGETLIASGTDARHERGPGLDARAHLVLRGWIDPVLRIHITDPDDPAPYWLVSTRRPLALATAITESRGTVVNGA
jgi:hypothetical protein